MTDDKNNKLTVAICTHNRSDMAIACVRNFYAQSTDPDKFRLLVIDNSDQSNHTDFLAERLDEFDKLQLVHIEPPSLSRARNEAIRLCETRYLAFIDDDAIPCDGWVRSILEVF